MNHAISGEILVQEVRFPRSEIFLATLVHGYNHGEDNENKDMNIIDKLGLSWAKLKVS